MAFPHCPGRFLTTPGIGVAAVLVGFIGAVSTSRAQAPADIPLAEHPRPDFMRTEWVNLNGAWEFAFDADGHGARRGWSAWSGVEPVSITVPFSWAAPLSGVRDDADVGWYSREVTIPADWDGRRVFVVVGAADWHTTAWVDGIELGTHQGGYTPFEFELTRHVKPGATHRLVIRVDDAPRSFKLEGKQGYGPARGIWQTVYLEARGSAYLEAVHFVPDVDLGRVTIRARLGEPAASGATLEVDISGDGWTVGAAYEIARGDTLAVFDVELPGARLWTLEDPFLHEVHATVSGDGLRADDVDTYFGMREISVIDLPGTDYRYVALNGEPVYLQLTLDQAYHPEGYYTFPSDDFIRDEVLRARQIGLNGLRVHVKIAQPRKLYWADRLGMLIMSDVPNSWGEPVAEMRREVEHAFRGMIKRDFNHPSIFAWVPFNETWGLVSEYEEGGQTRRGYLASTQDWVASMFRLGKSLDSTRLVEDNSPCCGYGHTATDLNSWHMYAPGWEWEEALKDISAKTYPGSTWNFEARFVQADQPNINSEFGNVWGYEGSTGDVDWSWDYHRAINEFRRSPRVAGWLYTEHHDVVNEWNGYWRYDRSDKFTGLSELVEGMSLRDLHAPLFISTGGELCKDVAAGQTVRVPLFASFMSGSDAYPDSLAVLWTIHFWDDLGLKTSRAGEPARRSIAYRAWRNEALEPLEVVMPDEPGLAILDLRLVDPTTASIYHRNFTTFVVSGESPGRMRNERGVLLRRLSVSAADISDASWTHGPWKVLDGLKISGAGAGFFEYTFDLPVDLDVEDVSAVTFLAEASARQLLGRDRADAAPDDEDYMRGRGYHDPGGNPNAYPMTDERRHPSAVTVTANGVRAGRFELPDDPADHRGILSWHSQLRDRRLRDAGSFGYRVEVPLPADAVRRSAKTRQFVVRLEVDAALPGGLAIYGARFGRYPMDPTVLVALKGEGGGAGPAVER